MMTDDKFVVYRSRTHDVLATLLGFVALSAGILLAIRGDRWMGPCLVAIGIVVAVFSLISFLDRKPVIIISNEGLWVQSGSREFIPWNMISSVNIKAMPRSGTYIAIFQNGEHQFDVKISGLDQSYADVYRRVEERLETYSSTTQDSAVG